MAGSGQIRMSPARMRERAGEVRVQGNHFEDAINGLRRIIVNELPAEWEGAASVAFADQFSRLEPAFKEMRQLVDQIGTQLDRTADATQQLDEDIARRFNQ